MYTIASIETPMVIRKILALSRMWLAKNKLGPESSAGTEESRWAFLKRSWYKEQGIELIR